MKAAADRKEREKKKVQIEETVLDTEEEDNTQESKAAQRKRSTMNAIKPEDLPKITSQKTFSN